MVEQKKLTTCGRCGEISLSTEFLRTRSKFYPNGRIPVCNSCIKEILQKDNYSWEIIDKLCQYLDIPFIIEKVVELKETVGNEDFFLNYCEIFGSKEYETIGWLEYQTKYEELRDSGALEEVVPLLGEQQKLELQAKWGASYDEEDLAYLENLFNGMLATQNVNGALQKDQAIKLCKISLEIDSRIREGADFDKMLKSYDSLIKAADFTPKNVKNVNDFDSVGELFKWLEKRGWKNRFYDNVTRDIVDETIKNFQAFNQRLYTNESGIGDEISKRIENLKTVARMENSYDTSIDADLDKYENEGYDLLMKDNDEFDAEVIDDNGV